MNIHPEFTDTVKHSVHGVGVVVSVNGLTFDVFYPGKNDTIRYVFGENTLDFHGTQRLDLMILVTDLLKVTRVLLNGVGQIAVPDGFFGLLNEALIKAEQIEKQQTIQP